MHLWDYKKNSEEGIFPENIKPGSDRKVWCICRRVHSWSQRAKKLSKSAGCPYCLNYSIIEGGNDFAALAPPELLGQWHLNVWWVCAKGHEWKASPDSRQRKGNITQCPYCAWQLASKGETDLETKALDLLEDLNYERNRKKPDEIHWGTMKKA